MAIAVVVRWPPSFSQKSVAVQPSGQPRSIVKQSCSLQSRRRPSMRILYDHQVFSLQDAGGASRYHFELVRHLQMLDERAFHTDVDMLMGFHNSVLPFSALRNAHTRVRAHRSSMRPGKARYAANEAFSAVSAPLCGKYDIYHPTLYRALPWVRRHRMVVTHHDCTHERFPALFSNADSIMATKRKLFAQADAIVCVSASSKSDLLHFYDVPEQKAHVVPHGFTPLHLSPAETVFPNPGDADPYLLYVGSRAGYKNFSFFLDAFARSGLAGAYRLWAVGGGAWTELEQKTIASLGLVGRVSLTAKATDDTLARAYRDAALFVYPSMYEGFGFPPLEAMSLGCPVLVNRTSSLPEVCGDAAFYFEGSDAENVARTLVSILAAPQDFAGKRQLGEEQVKLYDWARCARSTWNVYRTVLQG